MTFDYTKKLYYENCYETRFFAAVLSCAEAGEVFHVILDKTLFYPEGGGQPYDMGTIGGANVLEVHEKGGYIIHTTDKPPETGNSAEAYCEICWTRRFGFMQHHTGEHIVSGLLHSLFGLSNIGFHMGEDYTTIDTDGEISAENLDIIEKAANRAIYKNAAVTADYPAPEALDRMSYRSKKELSGDVRIVTVQGFDACACCGLHCKTTGEVGLSKIINSHKYKSGTRIYMLCGEKALLDYNLKNKSVYALSALLSAKPSDVVQAVEGVLAENTALKEKLSEYKNEIFTRIASETPSGAKTRCIFMDGLSPDDLRRLALLASERAGIAAVFSGDGSGGYKYALGSKSTDMKAFAASLNAALNGRGGGQTALAQGTLYASSEDIKAFFRVNL